MDNEREEREYRAERHAETVLERRNRAFRILYDTVLGLVGLKGRSIYLELCRGLRDISGASGAALAVYEPEHAVVRLEAYSCMHGVSLMESPSPAQMPREQVREYIKSQWIRPKTGESWLSRLFPTSHIVSHIREEDVTAYEVSCAQEDDLAALCLLLYPQGMSPKMKDMIDAYLHVIGLTVRQAQTNRMLVESERKYRTLIETTGTGYSLLTPNYEVIDANSAYLGLSGHRELGDIRGRCMTKWLAPGSQEIFEKARYACADEGYARNVELEFVHDGSGTVPVEMNFTIDGTGSERIIIGLCRDISERKTMESHIQHMQRMEVVGRMAGGIAHDFNNILFSVMGFSQLVARKLDVEGREHQNVQEVIRAAKRGKELVEQILIFSRWRERDLVAVDLAELVNDSLAALTLMIPESIEVLAESQETVRAVLADPVRLRQAITNICANAVQAMALTGGTLRVTLGETVLEKPTWAEGVRIKPGTYAKLSIADSGPGISAEARSRIFEPFFTTKGPGQGSGLGLAAVHGILAEFRGGIMVNSEPGKGADFQLYLPVTDEAAEARPTVTRGVVRGSGNVMVVDDEQTIASLLKQMLSELGYQVSAFIDPETALGEYERNPMQFDLVIADQTMPRIKGMELAERLFALRPDARVVLVTGFSDDITPEIAVERGCYRCLIKPVEFEVLAACVAEALVG